MSDERDIVERLSDADYRGPMQHLRGWNDLDVLHDDAAGVIKSLRARVAELEAERDAKYDTSRLQSAMQNAWNDFVADTGCYPEPFRRRGHLIYADFSKGSFVRMVGEYLKPPPAAPREGE